MKINVTVFLVKEGVPSEDVLEIRGPANHINFNIEDVECDFYWKTKESTPQWVGLFSGVENINTNRMTGRSLQGVLQFTVNERLFIFTFGHARHLIDQSVVERNFGLKVALGLSDPELIKSIDKANIDKNPFRSRTQASKYTTLSEFQFKFDWEILKSLTGIVESDSDDEYEVISGTDAVSLYTDISLSEIPATATRLLNAYQNNEYREKYPWIDYIVPLKDSTRLQQLNERLVQEINGENYDEIWISPPSIISYDNFSGYCYRKRITGGSYQALTPDLDLEPCLRDKGKTSNVELPWLKSTKIFLYDGGNQVIGTWDLYQCLNAEFELHGQRYLLSEGSWYQVDRDFVTQIESYFDGFEHSSLEFPNYRGSHERPYLESVADNENFYLLDQKLIRLQGATSSFEFCDLITPNDELIHVKKYSSSSVLSHLFSQAYVSAESLLRSREVVEQVNGHLAGNGEYQLEFDPNIQPRKVSIILAIMQKKAGPLHMPFFSKVNFRQYSQRLQDMGYKVLLKKIEL